MKKCSNPKCIHEGEPQEESNFYVCNKNDDGLQVWCKYCQKKYIKEWQIENPETHKNNNKNWKIENPERNKEITKEWNEENPERARQNKYIWRDNNPKKTKKSQDKYYKKTKNELCAKKRERYKNDLEYRERKKKKARDRYHKNKPPREGV